MAPRKRITHCSSETGSVQSVMRFVPPIQFDTQPRHGGQLQGTIWIAEDFDAPDLAIERLFDGGEP